MIRLPAAITAALFCSSAAIAQAQVDPAALFGARESISHVDLSPDGTTVTYVAPHGTRSSAANVAQIQGGTPQAITKTSGEEDQLSWCSFASDQRLICRVRAILDYEGFDIAVSRLFAMDADGKNAKQLGQSDSFYDTRLRQFDGSILDWLPDDGNAILMSREYVPEQRLGTRLTRNRDGLGVDRIDLKTLKPTIVEPADRNASLFMTDGRGAVRIKASEGMQIAGTQLSGVTSYYYRKAGGKDWEKFGSFDSQTREGMLPLAIDASIDSAYVLRKLNGRFALYRIKLDGSMAEDLAYANDKVDVDNVVRVGRGQKVIGVTFAEEARQAIYFDPEYKKLAAALSKALPKLPLINFVGASKESKKLLIFAGSDSDPGRYYVYDRTTRNLAEIMLVRPQLEGVALASVKPVTFPATDGAKIPAYLTLPPGAVTAKGLPAIVLPHGGPSHRDEWGFDWLPQFLVNQGYAVLQPNYRGSDGYGDDWLKQNGFQSWKTSIGDITAGARWLVSEGMVDPDKLAILGWSYGGYAALQSAVTEPDLYKAAIAIAPVTDLGLVKEEARNFTNSALVAEFIGSGRHIAEGSPLQNVERIKVPVLMFHGDRDINVGVRQSKLMDSKLKAAGKKSELVVFEGLEHSLVDSAARTQMLRQIADFLKQSMQK